MAGCGTSPPAVGVESSRELGVVAQSAHIIGRDGGWGVRAFDREVFLFGDTFVDTPDVTGSSFHSNSWSFTDDPSAADGLDLTQDRPDAAGSPQPLIAPTDDEAAFIAAHRGDNDSCAEKPCGARWATWAGATVFDAKARRALISYALIYAEPGPWSFHGVGQSLAVWNEWTRQAERPLLGNCPDHPTLLFCENERDWTSSLVVEGDDLYGLSCSDGSASCKLARVPLDRALERGQWQAWNGHGFGPLDDAAPLFDGGLNARLHYNKWAGAWMVIYSKPFSNQVTYRTAPALTGPWSDPAPLFVADRKGTDGFTYDAYVQPDYSEEDGRVLYLTFSRPSGGLFSSELALERVSLTR